MEAVKGLRGFWHYTIGDEWRDSDLITLCGKAISPNFRRFNPHGLPNPPCVRCLQINKETLRVTAKALRNKTYHPNK